MFEADNNPVGEAQDEPNENPRLQKPTEGRGLLDRLSSLGIDVRGFKFPNLGFFKTLIIIISIVGTLLAILFMVMMRV